MSKPVRPQWADATPRCQCGAALDGFEAHSTADARRFIRVYARPDGCVPACPACVDSRDGRDDVIATVPVAMKHWRGESSVEGAERLLEREAMRE